MLTSVNEPQLEGSSLVIMIRPNNTTSTNRLTLFPASLLSYLWTTLVHHILTSGSSPSNPTFPLLASFLIRVSLVFLLLIRLSLQPLMVMTLQMLTSLSVYKATFLAFYLFISLFFIFPFLLRSNNVAFGGFLMILQVVLVESET